MRSDLHNLMFGFGTNKIFECHCYDVNNSKFYYKRVKQ